jgi:hypothetical protein
MVRSSMNEKHKSETKAGDQREEAVRRPWHAPQFHVADFSLTKTSTHANDDGGYEGTDGTLS